MSGRVTWRRRAEQDLADAYAHIGSESPASAERLLDAVDVPAALKVTRPPL
jgi:plasmid stabilization system protein ParE